VPRTDKDFSSRKEQLVKLALDQFLTHGYENTTINDLQKTFGLTKGGMYHYFGSKEEILDAVIEYGLAQSLKESLVELENMPADKKLIHFFFSTTRNSFTQRLFALSKMNQNSVIENRLREKTVELTTPVLKEIFRQYVESGYYQTDYPDEIAEFSVILAMAITDEGLLTTADSTHRKKRVDALLDLWEVYLRPPPEHLLDLRENLYQLIKYDEGEN